MKVGVEEKSGCRLRRFRSKRFGIEGDIRWRLLLGRSHSGQGCTIDLRIAASAGGYSWASSSGLSDQGR